MEPPAGSDFGSHSSVQNLAGFAVAAAAVDVALAASSAGLVWVVVAQLPALARARSRIGTRKSSHPLA